MLTIVMAMLGNLLSIYPGGGTYLMTPPPGAEISVRRGQSAVIYNVRAYETDPTCQPMPAVEIDTWPHPQLGTISTSQTSITDNGPCGTQTYPIKTVTYTAGPTTGVETFQLYFYMTDGSRDQRSVNVYVR